MAVKLVGIIFVLLIELASIIFTLSMKVLIDVILILLFKGPCVDSKAGRYYLCSINETAGKCHLCIIIESHYKRKRLGQACTDLI